MLQERKPTLDSSIFRAYDIRGIVGKSLTEETVFLIGKALGTIVLEKGEKEIVVARDGRLSGPVLIERLSAGILSTGCDVIDIGMVPTPLLYFATNILGANSGVMLTGSHNPPDYNGLKIVVGNKMLAEEQIQLLYQRILDERFVDGAGKKQEIDVMQQYIDAVKQRIRLIRPLNIVIDAGNGITGNLAPALFRALGCTVHTLYCEVDGTFPNHHPDPSQAQNLQDLIAAVATHQADLGIAFDGDGDRLGVVTNKGEVIWPDRILMLYAEALLKEKPGSKIIYDVKCTHHLDARIRELNGEPIMWKTGHSLIKSKMAETQAALAGEMSGHFFFRDRWYGFDDALYSAARLLEILAQRENDAHTIFANIPNSINTPELKVFVTDAEKFILMQRLVDGANFTKAKDVLTIDGLRVNFNEGWGLVRPSNTTPYLILRFEAINQVILEEIQAIFRQWMLSVEPDLELPF